CAPGRLRRAFARRARVPGVFLVQRNRYTPAGRVDPRATHAQKRRRAATRPFRLPAVRPREDTVRQGPEPRRPSAPPRAPRPNPCTDRVEGPEKEPRRASARLSGDSERGQVQIASRFSARADSLILGRNAVWK